MEDTNEIVVDLLSEFLGSPKKAYPNKSQYSFNCVECDEDRHKGNLEVNIEKSVYHCWSCGESGSIYKLISKYGNANHKRSFEILKPDSNFNITSSAKKISLPENFKRFSDVSDIYPPKRQAMAYLRSRGITNEIISKYDIGFCDTGDHAGRIIVPSYDRFNKLNYYIGRSWYANSKAKYKNPDVPKNEIIFNENLINWNGEIYLTEGVFDAMFLPNSIPMLGKFVSEKLFNTLYEKAGGYIIIALDGDAFENAKEIYHHLNGGRLFGRIKILKLPSDKDVADLRGNIDDYYFNIN